jgi:hypothetical protein
MKKKKDKTKKMNKQKKKKQNQIKKKHVAWKSYNTFPCLLEY